LYRCNDLSGTAGIRNIFLGGRSTREEFFSNLRSGEKQVTCQRLTKRGEGARTVTRLKLGLCQHVQSILSGSSVRILGSRSCARRLSCWDPLVSRYPGDCEFKSRASLSPGRRTQAPNTTRSMVYLPVLIQHHVDKRRKKKNNQPTPTIFRVKRIPQRPTHRTRKRRGKLLLLPVADTKARLAFCLSSSKRRGQPGGDN